MAEAREKLIGALLKKLHELSEALEKASIAEYVALFQDPRRLLYLNFLAGISRGFGIAVGFTAVGAVFLYLLGKAASLNLPVIGHFIAEIARIVESELRRLP
ncbi:MAG: hypothetical protein GX047_03410 [Firmicutes bacterium]|jgi:hypothetical protein|nr:hypothetical protein [Bacillota bacterium]